MTDNPSLAPERLKSNNPDYALQLGRGRRAFPCHEAPWTDKEGKPRKAKEPYTPHGFKDATRDIDQITRWWKRWPGALVGIATGKDSGFFAIDIDVKNDHKGKRGHSRTNPYTRRRHYPPLQSGPNHQLRRRPLVI